MTRILYSFLILILFSCNQKSETVGIENQDSVATEVQHWQDGFKLTHHIDIDSIWGKPVRFYVTNKDCDPKALAFYLGTYRPTDEPETARLLSLATTDNDSLRPFYRWILNKTILIQDGALAEYTGVPARKYAEKFPKEFFEYMDFDQSGEKYSDWVNAIAYSGFESSDNHKKQIEIAENLASTMVSNCLECDTKMKERIEKFSKDCFSMKN